METVPVVTGTVSTTASSTPIPNPSSRRCGNAR
jgi:hypothetical protein